jgi:hypothetical protein
MKPAKFFGALGALLFITLLPANCANSGAKPPVMLKGSVDVVESSCYAAGLTLSSKTLPSTVEKVRLGSPALYAGIAEKDKVLNAEIADNRLILAIERDGQRFSAYLPTAPVKVAVQVNQSAVPTLSSRAASLGHDWMIGAVNRRGMYMHVGRSPVVWTRMGLCGSWDAQGEGRRRWSVLATELFRNPGLSQAWEKWQSDICAQVQKSTPNCGVIVNAASVHLIFDNTGRVLEYSPYNGPERPYHDPIGDNETRRLIEVLKHMSFPGFPSGSQATEVHLLIYLTNEQNCSVYEGH